MSKIPTKNGTAAADETAITKPEISAGKRAAIADALKARVAALGALLGGRDLADRFCRAALAHWSTTRNQSPKDRARLEAVDADSYAAACQAAALDRLTPDGRDGWIVVRGDGSAAWTISYRGMVRRFRRAVRRDGGRVAAFCAEVVYRQEIDAGAFDVELAARSIRHRPWYLLGVGRTEIDPTTGETVIVEPSWEDVALVYAAVTVVGADGEESREFRILTIAELRQRARMSGDPKSDAWSDAWNDWPRAMAKKAAVRGLLDWLATPDELADDPDEAQPALPEPTRPRAIGVAAAVADRVRALDAAATADPHGALEAERAEADAAARAAEQGDA